MRGALRHLNHVALTKTAIPKRKAMSDNLASRLFQSANGVSNTERGTDVTPIILASSGTTVPSATTGSLVSTLSLATREDAYSWDEGCRGLGFTSGVSIKKPRPTLSEIQHFFKSLPIWAYIGGHFADDTLYNEDNSVEIVFAADGVGISIGGTAAVPLKKGTPDFLLDQNLNVLLWGGCSICSGQLMIKAVRQLFG